MSISTIIELFQTPTCFVISFTFPVLACGFVLKDLHISHRDIEIDAKSKKNKKKRKK